MCALRASGARLVRKDKCWPMRAISWVLGASFLTDFWTTYRLPFGGTVIAYPLAVTNPLGSWRIIEHELYHVRQFARWWGPIVAPLAAILPPGRWLIEREAYANDIQNGRYSIDQAVAILWEGYGKPWPRSWMRAWFKKQTGAA